MSPASNHYTAPVAHSAQPEQKKTLPEYIKDIRTLLDKLQDAYDWDVEQLNQVIDEKTDLLDKYVSETDTEEE